MVYDGTYCPRCGAGLTEADDGGRSWCVGCGIGYTARLLEFWIRVIFLGRRAVRP